MGSRLVCAVRAGGRCTGCFGGSVVGLGVLCWVGCGAGVRRVWGALRKAGIGYVEWDGVRVGWGGVGLAREG